MSENLPPSEPGKEPPEPFPIRQDEEDKYPSKKICAFLGFLLFVVSGALTFALPPICLIGLALAITSLFFRGYRFIFVGYILTVGVLLLGVIIYCSNHPFEDR